MQSARESARITSCRSNVAQLTKGLLHHETSLGYFPTGGWGPKWLGVADRNSDASQPGGWIYSVLPYIEETTTRNIVQKTTDAAQYQKLVTTSLPTFSCPSRRGSRPLPIASINSGGYHGAGSTAFAITTATRSDYAANSGSQGFCVRPSAFAGIPSNAQTQNKKVSFCHHPPGNPDNYSTRSVSINAVQNGFNGDRSDLDYVGDCDSCGGSSTFIIDATIENPQDLTSGDNWRKQSLADKVLNRTDNAIPDLQDGIVFRMSRLQAASVLDGLSNVYLIGEKYVSANTYSDGSDPGDSSPMLAGYASGNVRWAYEPPTPDKKNATHASAFGSAHAGGWNAAFADGSVKTLSYTIDPDLHKKLAARDDIKRGGLAGAPP